MPQAQIIDRERKPVQVSCSQSPQPRRWGSALVFAAAGAISFWMPDVLIHAHAGPTLDTRHAWAITLLVPAIFLAAYLVARKFAARCGFKIVGPPMLLGVWLSGGLFMTLAAMLSRSEFIGGTGIWRLVTICLSLIPIVTYVLASYDGSLFALLAVTFGGLLIVAFRSSISLRSSPAGLGNTPAKTRVSKREESRAA